MSPSVHSDFQAQIVALSDSKEESPATAANSLVLEGRGRRSREDSTEGNLLNDALQQLTSAFPESVSEG